MPRPVARILDLAGGPILGPGLVPNVTVNMLPIALLGNPVTPHGLGIHAASTLAVGSPNTFVGPALLPVCAIGDVATCGHPIVTGSPTVYVN